MNQSPETRASLILRLQSDADSQVWDEFVGIYQSVIYRTARRQGLGHEDACEVVQEVLARVTKSIDRWEHDPARGTFRGWLYRITRNLSIDFLRKAVREPVTGDQTAMLATVQNRAEEGEAAEFDRQFERQLFRRAARRIEDQFTANSWQAFWRTAVEGMPIHQVANELGMTRGAIYIARSRIMARLKEEVQMMMNETMR